ncbi:MAG: cupin domain-containing protein [Desulfococcaceae bacterium]
MPIPTEPLSLNADDRGIVFEPITADELPHQKNAHIVITRPGAIRGNHFHRQGTEIVAVMGPALVRYRFKGELYDVTVEADTVYRFVFPPGVPHAIQNTGDRPQIMAAFNTMVHDPANPDTLREELISG